MNGGAGDLAILCASTDFISGDPYSSAGNHFTCDEISRDDAGVNVTCSRYMVCGRRFEGLVEARHAGTVAEMAWLEEASVHAFVRLAADLEDHGAPAARIARWAETQLDADAKH